ncbi:TonB-dependent receptor plug domain-containing protein [Massilia horti]|uniref:TonB-dependent receptor n=1 Tax=Massilia horti TaxID=2562153 RepID=A0A4Y9SP94_9BURK|nr:TonB-dependent receptor [Massilia horti]TFW27327.1 TonB-dependent receptor [Massilia horti]
MPFQPTRIALAVLLLSPSVLMAQSKEQPATPVSEQKDAKPANEADQSKDEPPMQTVEVKGSANDYDPRRDDTASKTVMNAEEIRKYGDTNVFDVLKRAPGVTVTGNSIRMRGLGGGYTQILVNGDRPPPGFSLDNLSPDQIERIEIVRAASAEYSMQAIAGTINIILRNVVAKPQRDVRISTSRTPQGRHDNASGTWAQKIGNLSYFLNGAAFTGRSDFWSRGTSQFVLPDGTLSQSRESTDEGNFRYEGISLFPRVTWKRDNGDELNVQVGLQAVRPHSEYSWRNNNLVGTFPSPDWVEGQSRSSNGQLMYRGEVNWITKPVGGKLDLTMSAERSRNENDQPSEMFTKDRTLRLERDWNTTTRISRYALRGKFTRSLFEDHSLVTGLDTSIQKNDETRIRNEQSGTAAPTHLVETFEPKITRLAGFVQDEWSINKQLSIYLGTRWEGVQTDSQGTGLANTSSRNHVLSPVAQTLYKLPGKSGRQLRLALTRTYKAPTLEQLTAKRYESPLNTRFAPDSSGNPNLRPELANGIDITYEHFWAPGALFSINASKRSITDYIRTKLEEDAPDHWLYHPLNDGAAEVRSLEAELKFPLKALSPTAPGVDLRASVHRNWSQVSTVPGPNNRLDAQTPMSASLGVDYKNKKGDLSLGTSLAYQGGGWVQISEFQSQRQQSKRALDAYALWKFDSRVQLRLSLANILNTRNTSERLYQNAEGLSRQTSFQPDYTRTGLNLEIKL